MRGLRTSAWLALASLTLASCAEPKIEQDTQTNPEVAASDAACDLLVETINSVEGYHEANFNPESRIAGCNGGESDAFPGFAIMRLNAVCREELCGSVLMGWYAVHLEEDRVFELEYENWGPGFEFTPGSPGEKVFALENRIEMPTGASSIHEYSRHYSLDTDGRIVGVFVRGFENAARQWHDRPEDIPQIMDGGCLQVNVRYDPETETFESVSCNGRA